MPENGPAVRSALSSIPPEVLSNVFALGVHDDDFYERQEPTIDVGGQSPWAADLRFKKSVVGVCRTWWKIGIRSLYRRIFIHRIGQLSSLIKTLEESTVDTDCLSEPWHGVGGGGKKLPANEGYGRWVEHAHVRFMILPGWLVEYCSVFERLLDLCPSLRSLSWKPMWDKDNQDCPRYTFSLPFRLAHLPHSVHLAPFSSLQDLAFTLDVGDPPEEHAERMLELYSRIQFPGLQSLSCDISSPASLLGLKSAALWKMPKLQHLALRFGWAQTPLESATNQVGAIFQFLEIYGEQLLSFTLDTNLSEEAFGRDVGELLRLCPNLVTLRYPICSFAFSSPRDPSAVDRYPNLRHSAILFLKGHLGPDGFMEEHLSTLSDKRIFPHIKTITLLAHHNTSIPFYRTLAATDADNFGYLLDWKNKLRERKILLLDVNEDDAISQNQERWGRWIPNDDDTLSLDGDDSTYCWTSNSDLESETGWDTDSMVEGLMDLQRDKSQLEGDVDMAELNTADGEIEVDVVQDNEETINSLEEESQIGPFHAIQLYERSLSYEVGHQFCIWTRIDLICDNVLVSSDIYR